METFNNISFKKLIMMLDVEDKNTPYNALSKKIRNFPSIVAAVNHFTVLLNEKYIMKFN